MKWALKWWLLKNTDSIPLGSVTPTGCLSPRRERLFSTIWYVKQTFEVGFLLRFCRWFQSIATTSMENFGWPSNVAMKWKWNYDTESGQEMEAVMSKCHDVMRETGEYLLQGKSLGNRMSPMHKPRQITSCPPKDHAPTAKNPPHTV